MAYSIYPMVAASAWVPTTSPFARRPYKTFEPRRPCAIRGQNFTLWLLLIRNQRGIFREFLELGGLGLETAPLKDKPVDDALKLSPAFPSIRRRGLTPEHLHTKTTPWSVFYDRSLMTITPALLQMRERQSPPWYYATGYNSPRREPYSRNVYSSIHA